MLKNTSGKITHFGAAIKFQEKNTTTKTRHRATWSMIHLDWIPDLSYNGSDVDLECTWLWKTGLQKSRISLRCIFWKKKHQYSSFSSLYTRFQACFERLIHYLHWGFLLYRSETNTERSEKDRVLTKAQVLILPNRISCAVSWIGTKQNIAAIKTFLEQIWSVPISRLCSR